MEVVRRVETQACFRTGQLHFLLAMARTMAPTQPRAAASVGVATPARIVPITVRIRAKGGTKLFMVMVTFWAVVWVRSSTGIGGPSFGLMPQRTST